MYNIVFSPEAIKDLEENEIKIVRILYGRRNFMQILFGES